jgi:hypothetical protein
LVAPALFKPGLVPFAARCSIGATCRAWIVAAAVHPEFAILGATVGRRIARGAEFIGREFAVAVAVELAEGVGGLAQFLGVDGTVVVCIKCGKGSG